MEIAEPVDRTRIAGVADNDHDVGAAPFYDGTRFLPTHVLLFARNCGKRGADPLLSGLVGADHCSER